jgi:hypothetical protein
MLIFGIGLCGSSPSLLPKESGEYIVRKMKTLISMAAFTIISVPCSAATWVWAGNSQSGTVAKYDQASLIVNGDVVTLWETFDSSRDKTQSAHSAKSKQQFNCKVWTNRQLYTIDYAASGKVINEVQTPFSSFEDIIPDTLGDGMAKVICAYAKLR